MRWDAMLLQETFRKLEGLETEGCQIFTWELFLANVMEVGDVQPSLCRLELVRNVFFLKSGDRWVSITMRNSKRVLISAHLATIKAPLEDFNVPLHEREQLIRMFFRSGSDFGNRCQHQGF